MNSLKKNKGSISGVFNIHAYEPKNEEPLKHSASGFLPARLKPGYITPININKEHTSVKQASLSHSLHSKKLDERQISKNLSNEKVIQKISQGNKNIKSSKQLVNSNPENFMNRITLFEKQKSLKLQFERRKALYGVVSDCKFHPNMQKSSSHITLKHNPSKEKINQQTQEQKQHHWGKYQQNYYKRHGLFQSNYTKKVQKNKYHNKDLKQMMQQSMKRFNQKLEHRNHNQYQSTMIKQPKHQNSFFEDIKIMSNNLDRKKNHFTVNKTDKTKENKIKDVSTKLLQTNETFIIQENFYSSIETSFNKLQPEISQKQFISQIQKKKFIQNNQSEVKQLNANNQMTNYQMSNVKLNIHQFDEISNIGVDRYQKQVDKDKDEAEDYMLSQQIYSRLAQKQHFQNINHHGLSKEAHLTQQITIENTEHQIIQNQQQKDISFSQFKSFCSDQSSVNSDINGQRQSNNNYYSNQQNQYNKTIENIENTCQIDFITSNQSSIETNKTLNFNFKLIDHPQIKNQYIKNELTDQLKQNNEDNTKQTEKQNCRVQNNNEKHQNDENISYSNNQDKQNLINELDIIDSSKELSCQQQLNELFKFEDGQPNQFIFDDYGNVHLEGYCNFLIIKQLPEQQDRCSYP